MHCGMCLPTCPTYDTTQRERNSPRGRIALMRAVRDGSLDVTDIFAEEMSYCLGCLACQTACPAGVNYAVLFEAARSDIQAAGVGRSFKSRFWRAVAMRFLFCGPRAANRRPGMCGSTSGADCRRGPANRTDAPPACGFRRLEPQTPAIAPAFSDALIARAGSSRRASAGARGAADRLRAGSRLP